MFVGREKELELLEQLYQSQQFECLILYGRRRVGKTCLLTEFAKKHDCIFYCAKEKNDALNLSDFSKTILYHYSEKFFNSFESWEMLFDYLGSKCSDDKKEIIIIDEFPFIASENPSIKSILQHAIDHQFSKKNMLLILCGSSISFMENEVMGYKSPLYGRSSSQLELKPFDYKQSAAFFPQYSDEDKLIAYGILGGIPCYLQAFDSKMSLKENVARHILRTGSFLKEEPQLLLRMELREPAIYNSIFEAISNGATRMNEIADKIHEESAKCSKYIDTLKKLRLVSKDIPCGDKINSKKSIYSIKDNFFLFWYQFIFSNREYYEITGEEKAASEILEDENINKYMGHLFEDICLEYMVHLAKENKLPFIPAKYGRWWGNNSYRHCEDDIDILLYDKSGTSIIICECKFRNQKFSKEEYEIMIERRKIFKNIDHVYYYAFSKSGFTDYVEEKSKEDHVSLITIHDLFM